MKSVKEQLLQEHSKRNSLRIAEYILSNPVKFTELLRCYLSADMEVSRRAAWVLPDIATANQQLLTPHLRKIIDHVGKSGMHDAVMRNGIKVLSLVHIPDGISGKAANICFRILNDHSVPVAIRCYAMTVLAVICKKNPGLKDELVITIKENLPFGSAGFRSRAGKTLKEIEKY